MCMQGYLDVCVHGECVHPVSFMQAWFLCFFVCLFSELSGQFVSVTLQFHSLPQRGSAAVCTCSKSGGGNEMKVGINQQNQHIWRRGKDWIMFNGVIWRGVCYIKTNDKKCVLMRSHKDFVDSIGLLQGSSGLQKSKVTLGQLLHVCLLLPPDSRHFWVCCKCVCLWPKVRVSIHHWLEAMVIMFV